METNIKRLVTLFTLLLTFSIFTVNVKAEEKINTNEWVTVTDKEEQLFELEIKNTGYQLLEYENNKLYSTEVKVFDENMTQLYRKYISGKDLGGVSLYTYLNRGTKIYLSVDIDKQIFENDSYFKFKYNDIADDRYPKIVDDLSDSTELKTKVFSYTTGDATYETFKYKVKESGIVNVSFNWLDGYKMGALDSDRKLNYIAVVNSDNILVDMLTPIIKKKNKLETYLKKGTYYFVVKLANTNKPYIKYELTAKNKKDDTVEHEWNRAVDGNVLQKLKLNKEIRGKISFDNYGIFDGPFNKLKEKGVIDPEQRDYDNDSFDFIAPKTATYTFTTTPIKSKIEKLKAIVWIDADSDNYIESKKKGKSLVASVKLKKGQKVYINVYNGFQGQQYKVKVN